MAWVEAAVEAAARVTREVVVAWRLAWAMEARSTVDVGRRIILGDYGIGDEPGRVGKSGVDGEELCN